MPRLRPALARVVRAAIRAAGRGGTTAPGRFLLTIEPNAIQDLGARLGGGTALVSATNGKTTTASMIGAALERTGTPVVRNRAGSNMHWGVATALLDAGRSEGELGLFEVDEAWLERMADDLDPRMLVLSNLFRDQLDRYGELETLADAWADLTAARDGLSDLVLCADDPLVADLGRDRSRVTYFGVDDNSLALPELQHAADSKHCRRCGAPYVYDAIYMGHLGHYRCTNCGRERPQPDVVAERVTLRGMAGSTVHVRTPAGRAKLELPLPGLYNVYNALAATAAALGLGATLDQVSAALGRLDAVFGRVEHIALGERDLAILLVKNPAGANEVLRTLTLEEGSLDLWLALNDRIADGRDVSWIWDADFELLAGRVARITCSGTRAEEMALRLKYAGIDAPIATDRDLGRSLDAAAAAGNGRPLYALPTYTALLELRDLLADRGVARRWSD